MQTQTPTVDAATAEIKGVAKEVAQNIETFASNALDTVKKHIGDNAKVYAFMVGGPIGLLVAHTVIEKQKRNADLQEETEEKEAPAAA